MVSRVAIRRVRREIAWPIPIRAASDPSSQPRGIQQRRARSAGGEYQTRRDACRWTIRATDSIIWRTCFRCRRRCWNVTCRWRGRSAVGGGRSEAQAPRGMPISGPQGFERRTNGRATICLFDSAGGMSFSYLFPGGCRIRDPRQMRRRRGRRQSRSYEEYASRYRRGLRTVGADFPAGIVESRERIARRRRGGAAAAWRPVDEEIRGPAEI